MSSCFVFLSIRPRSFSLRWWWRVLFPFISPLLLDKELADRFSILRHTTWALSCPVFCFTPLRLYFFIVHYRLLLKKKTEENKERKEDILFYQTTTTKIPHAGRCWCYFPVVFFLFSFSLSLSLVVIRREGIKSMSFVYFGQTEKKQVTAQFLPLAHARCDGGRLLTLQSNGIKITPRNRKSKRPARQRWRERKQSYEKCWKWIYGQREKRKTRDKEEEDISKKARRIGYTRLGKISIDLWTSTEVKAAGYKRQKWTDQNIAKEKKNHAKQTYGEIMLLFSFICKKCDDDDDVDVDERMFFSKGWRQPKSLIELFWRENSRVSVRECAWVSVLFSARCWDERTFEPSACWLFELCSSDRLSYFSTRSKQWMGVESRQTFPTHYIHIGDSR